MTPPEPTDRYLKKLDEDAMIERSDRGDDPFMSDVLAYRRRALFTAGERHMLDKCIRAVQKRATDEMPLLKPDDRWIRQRDVLSVLESLRDAPAGEPNQESDGRTVLQETGEANRNDTTPTRNDAGGVGSSVGRDANAGGALGGRKNADARSHGGAGGKGAEGAARYNVEGLAKPEAAGEEPAIDLPREVLDELFSHIGHPNHMIAALRLREDSTIIRPLLQAARAWLDRPAPAAKEAGEQKVAALQDTLIAASVGWSRKNDRLTNERDDLKEERDRLRARVAELEKAAAKG